MANIISSVDGILNVYDDGTIDIVGGSLHIDGTQILAGDNSAVFTGLTVDSPTFVVDSVNNRVGIGSATPSNLLHLAGSSGNAILELQRTNTNTTGTVGAISFTASDGHSVSSIYSSGDGDNEGAHLIFATTSAASANSYFTSTTERMRITSGGNVNITNDLTVGGNLTVEGTTTTLNTATLDVEDLNITVASGAANAAAANGAGITVAGANADLTYQSAVDAWKFNKSVGINTNATSELHIAGSDNGDVGISIVNTLDNNGTNDADAAASILLNAASNNGYFRVHGAPTDLAADHQTDIGSTASTAFLTFTYGNAERMRIENGGNVGIGTNDPASKLHVHGTGTDGQEILEVTSNGNVGAGGYHWMTTATAGSQTNTNSTMIMYVGQALSNKNGGYLGFNYQGASSDASFLTLGGYQSDKLLNIRMDGKVGIGTTNPGGHLDVRVSTTGNLLSRVWNSDISGTGSSTVRIANSGNNAQGSRLEFSDTNYYVGTITSDRTNGMQFYSGQQASPTTSLGMTLDINGNLGIGVAPTHDLTVKSDIAQISPDGTNTIVQRMTDADVLSWSGDSGQLFSISDNLTGTIFSVNDVSGIPSLEVDDDGTVRIAETFGNVLIGTNVDDGSKLKVNGPTYLEDDWNRINVGNTNNTSSADTIGLHLHNSSGTYSNGQWTHRLRKYDHGGGVPLYIDQSSTTANTFTALARFGTYSGNNYEFEVFGDVKATTFTGSLTGNASTASKWATARTITLAGDLSGNVSIDGSANVTLTATVADNSHSHDTRYLPAERTAGTNIDGVDDAYRFWTQTHSTQTTDGTWPTSYAHVVNLGGGRSRGLQLASQYGTSKDLWFRIGTDNASSENGANVWKNWRKLFHDDYHPNADKWTTARTATVTLTGDATGTAGVSVDGSANWTNSIAVTVGSIDGQQFVNTRSNSGRAANSTDGNGIYYYTSDVDNFSGNATDGAIYQQSYSTLWYHQIAGDYRSGNIAVRGKNNNTWQRWKSIPTIAIQDAAPSTTLVNGDLWYESDTGTLYVRYAGTWVDVAPQLGVNSDPQFNSLGLGVAATGTAGQLKVEGNADTEFGVTTGANHNVRFGTYGVLLSTDTHINHNMIYQSGWQQINSSIPSSSIRMGTSTTADIYFQFATAGSTSWNTRFEMLTDGGFRADGDVVAYYSDERLKDFQGTIPNALDKVMQLNGYYFTENEIAKELGYNNDKRQVGVSAQEVEKVLPEVVTEAPVSDEYLTVKYEKMVPLLIEAIKEQQTMIDELKEEIKKLKGDV